MNAWTHDSIVHTVLGLMGVQTRVYRPELDILHGARPNRRGAFAASVAASGAATP